MTKTASLLFAFLLTLLVGACTKTGQVHVTKSLETKLDQFPTVQITATGTTAKTNRAARKFEKLLGERLKKAGVFEDIESSASLVMRCKVTHMDFGDELKRELSLKGKAKVTIEIRITEPDGSLLGHITATAQTAKRKDEEPALRVLEMAADAVVDYMKERKGKASSAKADKGSETKTSSDEEAKVDEADAADDEASSEDEDEDEDPGEGEEEKEEEEE